MEVITYRFNTFMIHSVMAIITYRFNTFMIHSVMEVITYRFNSTELLKQGKGYLLNGCVKLNQTHINGGN